MQPFHALEPNRFSKLTIHAATCTTLKIGIMSNFLKIKYIIVMFVYCLYQNNPHPISSNFNLRSRLHSCWRDNRTMVRSCDEEFIWIHITKQYKDTIVDLIYLCSKRAARWPCISVTYSIYMKYNKCTNILSVKKYIFSVISLYIPYKYATKLLEIFWVNSQLRLEEINT